MQLRLDRATFRHLIQLHILTGLASIAATASQFVTGRWYRFGGDFDRLVVRHFGPERTSDPVLFTLAGLLIITLAWHVASIFGLFRFRQWGRFGFVASLGAAFLIYLLGFGLRPMFVSPLDDLLAFLDSALFGAILLLAYAKDHGGVWFAEPAVQF